MSAMREEDSWDWVGRAACLQLVVTVCADGSFALAMAYTVATRYASESQSRIMIL